MEAVSENATAAVNNDSIKKKDGSVPGGRRGERRLVRINDFLQNLESVKDLHDNVASGKLYLVHRMLTNCNMAVDSVNEEGDTALMVAINCGQKETFRLLLKHGADPNIRSKPREKASGICENSPLWMTIRFRDLEWCELLMEAGYVTTKDEEKEGWIDALRGHLDSIEKKKREEGIDLTQDPFNLTYSNFFQWFDTVGRRIPFSLAQSCRRQIRRELLRHSGGNSIFGAVEEGLGAQLPRMLKNFLLLQDGDGGGDGDGWLEDYKKNKAKAFEKMFVFVDDCARTEKAEKGGGGGGGAVAAAAGLNVAHG